MQIKSRIRSRWYRANEKPLLPNESCSSLNPTPVGEIKISSKIIFKDDLDDEVAREASRKNNQVDNSKLEKSFKKKADNFEGKNGTRHKSRSNHRKKKDSNKNFSRNGKNRSKSPDNGKIASKRKPDRKSSPSPKSKKEQPKSGVSKFLSKLFGS